MRSKKKQRTSELGVKRVGQSTKGNRDTSTSHFYGSNSGFNRDGYYFSWSVRDPSEGPSRKEGVPRTGLPTIVTA